VRERLGRRIKQPPDDPISALAQIGPAPVSDKFVQIRCRGYQRPVILAKPERTRMRTWAWCFICERWLLRKNSVMGGYLLLLGLCPKPSFAPSPVVLRP